MVRVVSLLASQEQTEEASVHSINVENPPAGVHPVVEATNLCNPVLEVASFVGFVELLVSEEHLDL